MHVICNTWLESCCLHTAQNMSKNGRIFPYKYGVHYNTGQRKSTVPSDQHKIKTSDRELGYKTENVNKK